MFLSGIVFPKLIQWALSDIHKSRENSIMDSNEPISQPHLKHIFKNV